MKTFFFYLPIKLYRSISTLFDKWAGMVGRGKWSGIVSNIFRFFTRVAKSSEKKRKQNKNTKQNRHRAEDKENIGWVSSFFHRTYSQTDKGKHVLISELINAPGTITSGKSAVYMSRSDNDMYVFFKIF